MAKIEVEIDSGKAKSGADQAARSIEEIREAAAGTERQFKKTRKSSEVLARQIIKDARVAAQAQNIMTAALGRSQATLAAIAAQQARGGFLRRMAEGAVRATERIHTLAQSISANLQPKLKLMGLAAVAAFGFAIKSSLEFEKTMSRITGLVGVAAEEVKAFKEPLLDIATATAKGPNELAEALFFITSAGAKGKKALDILEASAKAAAAGLGETKDVADAVTSAVNAYGAENLSAAMSTDILVASVREGKAAANEIAGAIGQVLPIASQLNVTFDQVGATIAALTRVGLNAAEASTALKATLNAISKPGNEAVETLKSLSAANLGAEITFEDVRKVLAEDGLIAALNLLQDATGGNTQELQKIFPNIRAGAGVFSLLGKNAKQVEEIFNRMTNTVGSTDAAFEAFADTNAFKVEKALNDLKISFKLIADELLPAVSTAFTFVARAVEETVKGFKGLGEAIADALSGPADPYQAALAQQEKLRDATDRLTFSVKKVFREFDNNGLALFDEVEVPLTDFQKLTRAAISINDAGIELTGTYEDQLAQLRQASKEADALVAQHEKELLAQTRVNAATQEQADILEEIVITAKKRGTEEPIIDSKLLTAGKNALSDLRSEVAILGVDLTNLQNIGKAGVGLAEDAAEATAIFTALQGQVSITKDEVVALIAQKRTLTKSIDEVTAAFERQDAANQTLDSLRQSITDITEQLDAAKDGGLDAVFATDALQQARLIMADLGSDTELTVQEIALLIEKERALGEALQGVKNDLVGTKDGFDVLNEFGIQAARNLQTAFADFLFDPFTEGLDGMIRGFSDTLRRLASEALSQKILSSLFGSIGGGIFQGGFAEGGDFEGGKPMLVGETGPEVITPRQPGTVVPNGMMQQAPQAPPQVNVAPTPVIVLDDPRKIDERLASQGGQRALVDAISNKRGAIKEVLK